MTRPDDQSSGYETTPDESGLIVDTNPIYRVLFGSRETWERSGFILPAGGGLKSTT